MRLKTILKELEEALTLLGQGSKEGYLKGLDKLSKLKNRLALKVQEEERKKGDSSKLRHLMGWYLEIWGEKPPEALRFMQPNQIIGKHMKELIAIYERNGEDIEALKRDYEEFRRTWKIGDKGILHFRNALPQIKKKTGFHMSAESRRGVDYYLKQLEEEVNWDEDDQLPF